ncbi:DNA-binding response regulator [Oscillospiraceae bacterium]|nr:DNA-binding response regulator [Oscillospiraceae bacterium]BDF74137.1 DNA-binding response regulator [Oscillospiraceae bacterium]
MSRTIAVVEDDESIREMLRYYFGSVGYGVRAYESGEAMLEGEADAKDAPVLYILDIMLPGMDGLEVLRRLRAGRGTRQAPVIMLTARTAEMDRVAGLESGADDYVVKPFGIMELQARVKAVLRRTQQESGGLISCGDLEIDPAAREVRRAGRQVELTYKEFELLRLLCTHRGVALTRDEILQSVWDYDYTGETRTVDMHVKALRQKLGEDVVTTVRGVGYKMS